MKENPSVTLLRIEGHFDSDAFGNNGLELSALRALEVKKYLFASGIDKARLLAVGFGEALPIADSSAPEGREKNRRIEFHIAEISGKKFAGRAKDGTRFGVQPLVPPAQ